MKSDLGLGSRQEGSLPIAAGVAPEIDSTENEAASPEGGDIRVPRDYEALGRGTARAEVVGALDANVTAKWR